MSLSRKATQRLVSTALNGTLALVCFFVSLPMLLALSTALKAPGESYINPGLIPQRIDFAKFVDVFQRVSLPMLARNSLIVTFGTVAVLLVIASMAAYAFARLDFAFKEPIYFLFLAGLMIPSTALIVPLYQLNVAYRLLNTYFALIGPYVALGLPFSILILRGFFESLPQELEDAARIDGASRLVVYWRVLLPLTKPALVTVGIFQGLAAWNDFLFPMLFITKSNMRTLPLGLMAFETSYFAQHEHRFALIVMMTAPVVLIFLLLQRYFMSGMTAGAIKG